MHWNGWHMGGMWIFWLVLLVAVVWLVAWGEIDRAEYEKKLEDLRR